MFWAKLVLAWLVLASMIGPVIGKVLKRARERQFGVDDGPEE